MSKYIVIVIMVIIGFMSISETTAQDYINQTNSTKSNKQKIIVTWLELNKTGDSPVISISSEDFWKIFGPLLELSSTKTTGTSEELGD